MPNSTETGLSPPDSPSSPASDPPAAAPPDRDAAADAELAELLSALDAEHTAHAAAAARVREVHPADDDKTGLPTDMNCLTAFDEMYYCYSLGGQFLNVYRYGAFRDCGEKSADWRFCLKTKVRGEVARRAMILQRNKEKVARYKVGKSSEDVWTVRKEPLAGAFSGDLEDVKDGHID